jgi:hypothetical protein
LGCGYNNIKKQNIMNLNRYTKAELISKFKKLHTENNSNKSILSRLIESILLFKSLILKITLIALIIKWIKKYSFIRKLWLGSNWILFSIFGISLVDIYGLEFISNILNYLRSTYFYGLMSRMLGYKVDQKEIASKIQLTPIDQSSTANQKSIKIGDWFDRQEVENKDSSYRNWYYLLALLLFLGLSWYYWDSINPYFPGLPSLPSLFKRKPKGDNIDSNIITLPDIPKHDPNIERSWWTAFKDFFDVNNWRSNKPKINESINDLSDIELVDRLKNLKNEASNSSMSHYFEEINTNNNTLHKGKDVLFGEISENELNRRILNQITGENFLKFEKESQDLLMHINHFITVDKTNGFPNVEIREGMYQALKSKLNMLSLSYEKHYDNWSSNSLIQDKIDKFIDLENILTSENSFNELAKSTAYEDVVLATTQEQDVWSNKTSSPSVHSPLQENVLIDDKNFQQFIADNFNLSEEIAHEMTTGQSNLIEKVENTIIDNNDGILKSDFNALFDAIKARRNDNDIVSSPPKIDESSKISELIDQAPKLSDSELLKQVENTIPTVEIDSGSNNSINQPEITTSEVKSGFNALFEQIKSRRLEYGTPKINQLGLQPHESADLLSPLSNKPSISNLFEDTMNLFDDDIDTQNVGSSSTDQQFIQNIVSSDNIIDSWNKMKVDISDVNKNINIDFGELWKEIDSIHIKTKLGYLSTHVFDANKVNMFEKNRYSWYQNNITDIIIENDYITGISIKDLSGIIHEIYKRD